MNRLRRLPFAVLIAATGIGSALLLLKQPKTAQEPPCSSQRCRSLCSTSWKSSTGKSFRFDDGGVVAILDPSKPRKDTRDTYGWFLTGTEWSIKVPDDDEAFYYAGSVEILDEGLHFGGTLPEFFGGDGNYERDPSKELW